jgi:hypothetical protein
MKAYNGNLEVYPLKYGTYFMIINNKQVSLLRQFIAGIILT